MCEADCFLQIVIGQLIQPYMSARIMLFFRAVLVGLYDGMINKISSRFGLFRVLKPISCFKPFGELHKFKSSFSTIFIWGFFKPTNDLFYLLPVMKLQTKNHYRIVNMGLHKQQDNWISWLNFFYCLRQDCFMEFITAFFKLFNLNFCVYFYVYMHVWVITWSVCDKGHKQNQYNSFTCIVITNIDCISTVPDWSMSSPCNVTTRHLLDPW